MLTLLNTCDACGDDTERTFSDSWTGMELCVHCLRNIIEDVTTTPSCDDNLRELVDAQE